MSVLASGLVKVVVYSVIRALVYLGIWRLLGHAPLWVFLVSLPVVFVLAYYVLSRLR